MRKIFAALLIGIVITGCSTDKKEVVTVCTNDSGYSLYESGTQTYTSVGDVVTKMSVKGLVEIGDAELTETIMSEAEEEFKEYNAIPGVYASLEKASETSIYDMLDFDFEVGDINELVSEGLLPLDSSEIVTYISLKQSISNIEAQGFTCKAN